jgi:hypothetical protein
MDSMVKGPLPDHRMGPAPVFKSTVVDLFGPLLVQDPYNKRKMGKAWGVVFVCAATSLVHVSMTKFPLHRLVPDGTYEIHDDPWDIQEVPVRPEQPASSSLQAAGDLGLVQVVQPDERHLEVGAHSGQHYNVQVERVIGMMKMLDGMRYSIMEMASMLAEAAQAVNGCPIARNKPIEDPACGGGGPITLLHLQLGWASINSRGQV